MPARLSGLLRWILPLVALGLALAAPTSAWATTIAGGNIINQTWTPAGNPYIVQGDITVPSGAFLTIQAGTVVQMAGSDGQVAGLDTARVELTVNGTLTVAGTLASPVQFQAQSGSTAGIWYGIVVGASAASVDIEGAQIQHAVYGVRSSGTGNVLSVTASSASTNTYGFYTVDGTPTFDGCTAASNQYGFTFTEKGGGSVLDSVARSNSADGIYIAATIGNSSLLIDGCTSHANGSDGLEAYGQSPYAPAVTIKSSNITQNSLRGVYRNLGNGATSVTTTFSNVWNNPSGNFSNASAGANVIAANPLYVAPPTNLRLTSRSPSRYAGEATQDLGPLPYVSDATPGLHGTLWANTTLSLAGSPYTASGDLTVAPGVTLTIDPGVTVQFATSDDMLAYADTARSELRVLGQVVANGTGVSPIGLTSTGSTAGSWYGVELLSGATGSSFTNVAVNEAVYGIWSQTTAANAFANILSTTNTYGFYVIDGAPTFTACTASSNQYGFTFTEKGGGAVVDSVARSNSADGVYIGATVGNSALLVDGCTLHANGSDGLEAYGQSPYAPTVTIKSSNITQNSLRGVYRNLGNGATTVTTTFSNVWNNPSGNFSNASAGANVISANPLYVTSPTNLRLSSNSPSRFAGESNQDLGPLPYVSDPTPGLHGTLWTNTTLTAAGSPYSLAGDLTVAPGVTLTIDPGVTLQFATSDVMLAYADTARAELRVQGRIVANGTKAQPITISSTGSTAGSWYGLAFLVGSAASSVTNVNLNEAVYGVWNQATASDNVFANDTFSACTYGVYVIDGSPSFDSVSAFSNQYGFTFTEKGGGTLTNVIARSNSADGVYIGATVGNSTLTVTNATLHANGSDGLEAYGQSPYAPTVTVRNSIVSSNSLRGIYRNLGNGATTVTTTYSDVWNNPSGNYSNAAAGTGCISQNPNYVGAPADLKLQMGSVAIDAAAATGAPNHDFEGVTRPINGDGINGAEFDMGAFEFASASFCGDGVQNVGESCDSGASNGLYGFCKADCSGMGPTCGDGVPNGPEQCDDANASNTDACLTTCQTASCGDGFLRAGLETCDDGNGSNTDACLDTCMPASCGDGFVRAGVETCDDGNAANTDACLSTCVPAACGDGFLRAGVETCDDGNLSNTDACLATCVPATCGDGFVRAGVETCDDGNVSNGDACLATCTPASCGDGFVHAGVEQCDDANGSNTDACLTTCTNATCGDGFVRTGTEQCDDANGSNTDACVAGCQAATCGDGFIRAGVEACDDANAVNGDACLNTCAVATCGDGVVQSGVEDCDDANATNTDACVTGCQSASCGDGFVQAGVEACDDANAVDTDACKNDCKLPGCGDGVVQSGEQCDDGNAVNSDACLGTCLTASCGDGFVRAGVEECDDGNADDTDACTTTCEPAACGDGFVEDGVEECDDGNAEDDDACVDGCVAASCGDGFVHAGVELCDDGNTVDNDACPNTCTSTSCGDGVKQSAEACDDGNLSNTDDCLSTCNLPACGDGFVHVGVEECDDGNGAAGDGCTPTCEDESMGTGGGGSGGGAGTGGSGSGGGDVGSGGSSGSGNPSDGGAADDSGCGCRTAGVPTSGNAALLFALSCLLVALRRRARRDTSP